MSRRTVSAAIIAMLLTSTLTLAFNIQPVKAIGATIYIRGDGSIDPPTAPIQRNGDIYTFADDIYDSIVIERDDIILNGGANTIQGVGSGEGINLYGRHNVTIKESTIRLFNIGLFVSCSSNNSISANDVADNYYGILIQGSSGNSVFENNMTNNQYSVDISYSSGNSVFENNMTNNIWCIGLYESSNNSMCENNMANNDCGIAIGRSSDNSVSRNNITKNRYGVILGGDPGSSNNSIFENNIANNWWCGIELASSSNNTIRGNSITSNGHGIMLDESTGNVVHHNNFIGNSLQVYDLAWEYPYKEPSLDIWDDGYPSGGNYWSDYTDVDLNNDGIWDHPYVIDANNQDNYPLVNPWANHFPFAAFSYYPAEPRAGEKVVLDASSSFDSDGRIVSYEWDWDGDGEYDYYSGTPTVEAWWIQDGTYNVGLNVMDDAGAESNASKQVVVSESATSRLNSMHAEWYDSLNFSQGLGQEKFETSQANTIMGWWPDKWRRGYKEFSLVDDWLRELDPGSKQLSWLKDTKFACLEVADVIYILNIEIDHESAPGFTYQTWAFNVLNEERLVHEAWKQSTPQYNYVMKPLLQYAFGTVWSLSISEQAILDLNLPLGIGVSTICSALKTLSIKNVMKSMEKTAYSQALAAYFRWRGEEYSHEDAWNDESVSKLARIAVPLSANDGERAAFLENMEWYFKQLWIKYEGSEYYGEPYPNQGLPLQLRREYREQVKNKLLSAMEKYSYYLPNKKKCGIRSPVELRVTDAEGRITGVVDGVELEEIPNSTYDNETETVTTLFPSDSLRYDVVGAGTGTYGLEITSVENGQIANFTVTDIPTSTLEIHQYTINWTALSQGEEGVTAMVDSDGNGVAEYNFTSDNELTRTEYVFATTKHDIEITGMTTERSVIGQGYNMLINLTITNYGPYVETFNVTSFANATSVTSQTIVLEGGNFTTLTFNWNTTSFAKGNYTVWAYAEPVQGETYTADNNFTGGWVKITIVGDVNGDGKVNLIDVFAVALAYGSYPGHPTWNPNYDINNDGKINLIDYFTAALNYGKTDP